MSEQFKHYKRGEYPWCRSLPCDCDEESLRQERCDWDTRYWACAGCGLPARPEPCGCGAREVIVAADALGRFN
jgi:hypothetical protein